MEAHEEKQCMATDSAVSRRFAEVRVDLLNRGLDALLSDDEGVRVRGSQDAIEQLQVLDQLSTFLR